jgi:biopolymer transport protein ExbD
MRASPLLRRRTARGDYDARIGLNMTPMVDVVMVILVFFMASASILGPEWLVATRVPKKGGVATATDAQPLRLQVTLTRGADASTVFAIGDTTFPREAALASLTRAISGRPPSDVVVLLRPANDVPYEDVVLLHAACQQLGLTKVGLGD